VAEGEGCYCEQSGTTESGCIAAVEKVQEATGLKLKETLGWTSEKVEEQKQEIVKVIDDVKSTINDKLEAAEKKVEKNVEEVKGVV